MFRTPPEHFPPHFTLHDLPRRLGHYISHRPADHGRQSREGREREKGLGRGAERVERDECCVAEVVEGGGGDGEEGESVERVADDFGEGPCEEHGGEQGVAVSLHG